MNSPFTSAFITEVRRRLFDESFPRLRKCLNSLPEEQIWHRPNDHVVSVGNLTLHLCGNARQWVLSGLGGQPDTRDRDREFDEPGPLETSLLLNMLDSLEADLKIVLENISDNDLLSTVPVQIYEESGLSILVHVVEHFSYHVGQITYFVKCTKDMDMGYYAGLDLNKTAK